MALPPFFDMFVFENIIKPLAWIGLGLSIPLLILSIKSLYTTGSRMRIQIEEKGKKIWLTALAFVIAIPFLTIVTFSKGIPILCHFISSEPGEIVVTVKRKSSSFSKRRCDGGFDVVEFSYFLNTEVCGISKENWVRLNAGDKVTLLGSKSFFGFMYDRYRI